MFNPAEKEIRDHVLAQEEDQQQMVISLQEFFQEDGIERALRHL